MIGRLEVKDLLYYENLKKKMLFIINLLKSCFLFSRGGLALIIFVLIKFIDLAANFLAGLLKTIVEFILPQLV
jgi:hypothetical protein